MATSGSYNFTLTKNNLIRRAFQLIEVYNLNATISSEDMDYASDILNSMLKAWESEGICIWKRRQATLFTEKDVASYTLGSTGRNATNSYVSTTISANEALGQTVLSITSTTGMTAGDYIGIELNDGSRQWTTIVSVDSAIQVTITASLTAAADAGNTVLTYTNKIYRPLSVIRATVYDLSAGSESVLQLISFDDYFDMPVKTTAGKPNNFYYDKLLDNGVLYLYPRPNNTNYIINFTYNDSFQDMDSSGDDFDFPQEWIWPITVNLAVELSVAYNKVVELQALQPKAEMLKMMAKNFDADDAPLIFKFNS